MKKKWLLFGIFILGIFLIGECSAKNYYISTGGADTNNGCDVNVEGTAVCNTYTGTNGPWRTIGKINTFLAWNTPAGDKFYFRRGDTFNDTVLQPDSYHSTFSSWAEGNYTLISAYGDGTAGHTTSNAKPILSGACNISNLNFTDANADSIYEANYSGHLCFNESLGDDLLWEDNFPLRKMGTNSGNITGSGQWAINTTNTTIYVRSTNDANPNTHEMISPKIGSIIANLFDYYKYENLDIQYGTGAFSVIGDGDTIWIKDCDMGPAITGVEVGALNSIIEGNHFHHLWNGNYYGDGGSTATYGYALYIKDQDADNVTFRNNFIEYCYGGFIGTSQNPDNVTIYNNIWAFMLVNIIDLRYNSGTNGNEWIVANNIIVHDPGYYKALGGSRVGPLWTPTGHAIATDQYVYLKLYNNLILNVHNGTGGGECFMSSASNGVTRYFPTADYNLYYAYGDGQHVENPKSWGGAACDNTLSFENLTSWLAELDNPISVASGGCGANTILEEQNSIFSDANPTIGTAPFSNLSNDTIATELPLASYLPGFAWTGAPSTDYLGNPIYDTPDIGAIEYQPPYNISKDSINTSLGKSIRIYGDGKYLYLNSTTDSTIVNLSLSPTTGFTANYSQWIDINITSWNSSIMNWSESSNNLGNSTNVTHTLCNLTAVKQYNAYYTKSEIRTLLARYTVDSSGCINFNYTEGYSTVTFDMQIYTPVSSELPAPSSDDTSPSGGGYPSITIPPEQIKQGIEKVLRENWKVSFNIGGENHSLKVNKITNNSATITISSNPVTITLFVGDEKKTDLNNDNIYDLYVKLNSITGKNANFTIKEINEKIPFTETKTTLNTIKEKIEQNIPYILIIAGILLLVIIAIVLSIRHYRKN